MPELISTREEAIDAVVAVIQAAGGELVGRTRLQKTIYLLEIAGFLGEFDFRDIGRHYGPYSEDLSQAVTVRTSSSGTSQRGERRADWGGAYSVYRATGTPPEIPAAMKSLISLSSNANPVALELAATAAFLAIEGYSDPWQETIERKSDKAKFLDQAKQLYERLVSLDTRVKLPVIAT